MSIINATGGGSMGGNVNIVQFGDMTPEQFAAACAGSGSSTVVPLSKRIAATTPLVLETHELGAMLMLDGKPWRIVDIDTDYKLATLRYEGWDISVVGLNATGIEPEHRTLECHTEIMAQYYEFIENMSNEFKSHCVPMYSNNTLGYAFIPTIDQYQKCKYFTLDPKIATTIKATPYNLIPIAYPETDRGLCRVLVSDTSTYVASAYISSGLSYMDYFNSHRTWSTMYMSNTAHVNFVPFICIHDTTINGLEQPDGAIHSDKYTGTMSVGNNITLDDKSWKCFYINGDYVLLGLNDYYRNANNNNNGINCGLLTPHTSNYKITTYTSASSGSYSLMLSEELQPRLSIPDFIKYQDTADTTASLNTMSGVYSNSHSSGVFWLPAYAFYDLGLNVLSADILALPATVPMYWSGYDDKETRTMAGWTLYHSYYDGTDSTNVYRYITPEGGIVATNNAYPTNTCPRPFIYYKYKNV